MELVGEGNDNTPDTAFSNSRRLTGESTNPNVYLVSLREARDLPDETSFSGAR